MTGQPRGADRGDAHWPTWLTRLMRGHVDGAKGQSTAAGAHLQPRDRGWERTERPAPGDRASSRHLVRFSEREQRRLNYLRWLFERGHLTEFP
jgi:hypothetical protein